MATTRTTISFDNDGPLGRYYAGLKGLHNHQMEQISFSDAMVALAANWERVINDDRPVLTDIEWFALLAAHRTHAFTEMDFRMNLLRVTLEDTDPTELRDWGLDDSGVQELLGKLRRLTRGQLSAVVEALRHGIGEGDGATLQRSAEQLAAPRGLRDAA